LKDKDKVGTTTKIANETQVKDVEGNIVELCERDEPKTKTVRDMRL